jgi:hypothetical protein
MGENKYYRWFVLSLVLCFAALSTDSSAQMCGTDRVHNHMMQNEAYRNRYNQLQESIYRASIDRLNSGETRSGFNCDSEVKTIPVVVHVMHLGEPEGTGSNISDEQIYQGVLGANTYLRNLDGQNILDTEIQIELAKRDPQGNPTNGIVRVNASGVPNYAELGVSIDEASCAGGPLDTEIKELSFWPVSDYYNIWVVHDGCQNFGGFAYYPSGTWYDGTVILAEYMNFGNIVLAHELGHGLNLKHTFEGDELDCPLNTDCLLDGDNVCDTPPHRVDDCGDANFCTDQGEWSYSRNNIMSYCFYVPNLFTQGQKERMQFTLQQQIRNPLLYSEALIPLAAPLEIGLLSIDSPENLVCSSTPDIQLLIKNYGTSPIQNCVFEIFIDGLSTGYYTTSSPIAPNESASITLTNCPVNNGIQLLSVSLVSVNNQLQDAYAGNNTLCKEIEFSQLENLPFCENFELADLPSYLTVVNPDGVSSWELTNTTGCSSANGTKTMVYDASPFSSNDPTSDDVLFLPFDLSNANNASLTFDVAHIKTAFCNTYIGLQVQASTDCGETFPIELYNKNDASTITSNCGGPNQCPCSQASPLPLQTVGGTYQASADNPWRPATCTDWRNETINLNALLGNESVILRFKANKATFRANNIYIDNVCLNLSYSPLYQPAFEFTTNRFTVFPNPGSGNFNLQGTIPFGETLVYRLFSSGGQLLKAGDVESKDGRIQTVLSLSELPSGFYSLQVTSPSTTQNLKLIHQQ